MSNLFVTVPMTISGQQLANEAVERLQVVWPDWEANEGDLEVVMLEVVAAMAEDAAAVAAQVPEAVFDDICEVLFGIVRVEGTQATAQVEFTVTDAPYTIPAGTEVDIDGYAFTTDADVSANPTAVADVTSVTSGSGPNDLAGSVVQVITAIANVVSVTMETAPSGGADRESVTAFRNRAVTQLQLQSTTLVTGRDYELMCLSQSYVGRATVVSDTVNRDIEVYALNPDGSLLSGGEKTSLEALLANYRLSNWELAVLDPELTDVDVTYTVKIYPGYTGSSVIAAVDAALIGFLDPIEWGRPTSFGEPLQSVWLQEKTVRVNKMIDVITDVDGVDYVVSVTLADGGSGSGTVQVNGDYLMNGSNPLARLGLPLGTPT